VKSKYSNGDKNKVIEFVNPNDLNKEIIDACYLYLKPKRKPRLIYNIHNEFIFKGYIAFTPEDLLSELLKDERFIVNNPEDQETLRAVCKKDLKKLRKDK